MKKALKILVLILLLPFQSCYFGAGLIEQQLTDNIWLTAINSLDEAEIIYSEKDQSVYNTLVPPAVFSVGHDDNFIIAKSHPKDLSDSIDRSVTYYYIIEIRMAFKDSHEQARGLTHEQFESERKRLKVPDELDFTINLEKAQ